MTALSACFSLFRDSTRLDMIHPTYSRFRRKKRLYFLSTSSAILASTTTHPKEKVLPYPEPLSRSRVAVGRSRGGKIRRGFQGQNGELVSGIDISNRWDGIIREE